MNTCWNRARAVTDYYDVDCEQYREALSARLDDEEGPADACHPADLHLEYCTACARWYDHAALITRRARTTAVVSWPDVSDAVLARVPTGASAATHRLRAALGAVGAAQGVTALFTLAGNDDHHTAAWQCALAVAFCAVAARRTPPAGLVPLLGTFVGVLAWGFVLGTANGAMPFALSAAGLVLVLLLSGRSPRGRAPAQPPGTSARLHRTRDEGGPGDGMRTAIHLIAPTKAA